MNIKIQNEERFAETMAGCVVLLGSKAGVGCERRWAWNA